jgi:predicted  nucleic acid-binding Zn-ribbon protein
VFEAAIISGIVVIGLAIVGAFWALADPRSEIKDIKARYLTVREHLDLVNRINTDIERIDQLAQRLQVDSLNQKDLKALHREIDDLKQQIKTLMNRSLIDPPPH